jgi:hypothetical protein
MSGAFNPMACGESNSPMGQHCRTSRGTRSRATAALLLSSRSGASSGWHEDAAPSKEQRRFGTRRESAAAQIRRLREHG